VLPNVLVAVENTQKGETMSVNHEPQGHEEYFFKGCLYALAIYAIIAALAVGAYFLGRWIIMLALAGA
jgi:hypothetical protein